MYGIHIFIMVRNTKGGNKAKKQARKSGHTVSTTTRARCSQNEDEVYACCSKMLGNGSCVVLCVDGKERLCIIRNKFRGKGKRGNMMIPGVWCLVGRRDFEKPREGKLEKTDLLEVYNESEKKYIIQTEVGLKDKWKQFNTIGSKITEPVDDDDIVNFNRITELPPTDSENESESNESGEDNETNQLSNLGDEIDINDI
jgi:initiation factor 1A